MKYLAIVLLVLTCQLRCANAHLAFSHEILRPDGHVSMCFCHAKQGFGYEIVEPPERNPPKPRKSK